MKKEIAKSTAVLEETIKIARSFRDAVPRFRELVWHVWDSGVWREKFSSWGEFVESEEGLGMSQGGISKLLRVHEYYIVRGGVAPAALMRIDNEKLYFAIGLRGSLAAKVQKAALLSRFELREEMRNPTDGCLHEQKIMICQQCHRRIEGR